MYFVVDPYDHIRIASFTTELVNRTTIVFMIMRAVKADIENTAVKTGIQPFLIRNMIKITKGTSLESHEEMRFVFYKCKVEWSQ